jgi:hypothetical protein
MSYNLRETSAEKRDSLGLIEPRNNILESQQLNYGTSDPKNRITETKVLIKPKSLLINDSGV